MSLLFYLLPGLSLAYAILLAFIIYGWRRLPDRPPTLQDAPLISVLIAARNEALSLPTLLESLRQQTYPAAGYEVMLIDDHSTDASREVIHPYLSDRFQLLTSSSEQQGKKQALALGVAQSQGEYLLTTDADCILPSEWLTELSSCLRAGADLVLAPVRISGPDNFLTAFQGLDVAGTMLLTGAAVQLGYPALANGANLGFRRTLLDQLGGYDPNYRRTSGDDVFLLHAAAQSGAHITYCKSSAARIDTEATRSWAAFFRQRLRWAGKTSSYRHWGLLAFQGFVFCLSWGLILAPILFPAAWRWWLTAWMLKISTDAMFLTYACRVAGRRSWLRWLLPASIVHPIYVAVIGLLALLPLPVDWKGRPVR